MASYLCAVTLQELSELKQYNDFNDKGEDSHYYLTVLVRSISKEQSL